MNAASITRQQRRAMQRHANANEPTIEADRRFFERRPDRTYRIRRTSQAELASLGAGYDAHVVTPPGTAPFTVVKQLGLGVRLRIFVPGPEDEDGNEAGDDLGVFLWNQYTQRHPSIAAREAEFQAAMRKPGGPLHDGGGR